MRREVDISLLGDKRLAKKLRKLPGKLQRKVVRQAMRKGAKPVLDRVKDLAPTLTGTMRDNIKIRSAKSEGLSRKGQIGYVVSTGTREEMGIDPNDKYYYPAAVEFGHGNVPAHSFLRRGLDETRDEARKVIADAIYAGVRREAEQR